MYYRRLPKFEYLAPTSIEEASSPHWLIYPHDYNKVVRNEF